MMASTESKFDLSELALIWYGGPLALILTRKNTLKLRKIEQMREYFVNEFGVYEVDSETEYRYGKQAISFYNSHGSRIPKKIVKRIKKHYQQGKNMEIKRDLEQIYPELKTKTFRSVFEIFEYLVELNGHQAIDIDTEKYLPFYRAYNPISIKRLNEVCQIGRKAIESLNPSLKPPFPIIVAVIGGIIALAFIQNGPKYVREAVAYIESFSKEPVVESAVEVAPVVEPIAPVIVVEPSNFILALSNYFDPLHFIGYLHHLFGG